MYDTIRSALFSIPPDDREVWFRMASALRRELGDADGFALWDEWSRGWPGYRESHARRTWRSAARERSVKQVTVGSLFYYARQWGWTGDITGGRSMSKAERERMEARQRADRDRIARVQRKAAEQAEAMLRSARMAVHPYLVGKGFEDVYMPVLGEQLLVPMKDVMNQRLWSVQKIWPDGTKRFMLGGRAGGLAHRVGGGSGARWLCEGLATGLSVHAAVRRMGRLDDTVVVCFAAANIEAVSERSIRSGAKKGDLVIADHDLHRCAARGCQRRWDAPWGPQECPECGSKWTVEPSGEKYARRSGLPYWLPAGVGDANDFMNECGLEALCDALSDFVKDVS